MSVKLNIKSKIMVEQTIVRCAMGQKPVFTFSAPRHGQSTNGQKIHHEDKERAEDGRCASEIRLTRRARRAQRRKEIIFGIVVSHRFFLCASARVLSVKHSSRIFLASFAALA